MFSKEAKAAGPELEEAPQRPFRLPGAQPEANPLPSPGAARTRRRYGPVRRRAAFIGKRKAERGLYRSWICL
jgi:hypothetical protein